MATDPTQQRTGYRLEHFHFEHRLTSAKYRPPPLDYSSSITSPERAVHGPRIQREFAMAIRQAHQLLSEQNRDAQGPGVYLEVKSTEAGILPDLTWSNKGIRLGAIRKDLGDRQLGCLYVPATAEAFLDQKVREYAYEDTPSREPKNKTRFAQLDSVGAGTLDSLWTDIRKLPQGGESIWWECWCWKGHAENLIHIAGRHNLLVSTRRLLFPEYEVVPIFGNRHEILRLVRSTDAVEELRRASDSPSFFTVTERRSQHVWVDDLLPRVTAPPPEHPLVCILDNGIASAHPLLAPAMGLENCHTINSSWGVHDHDPQGHGTNMAGCVLYGDLTYPLSDQRQVLLVTGIESVKFVPPSTDTSADASSYGSITQAAIRVVESVRHDEARIYCMAITNDDVSGERPTSWSAALDQICSGNIAGDDVGRTGRLFFVSAGNIADSSDPDEISDQDEFPIEDPAQAWNAIAVGGYTEKVDISAADKLPDWRAVASAGDLSPYSRISTDWDHGSTAIKPEVVFEAGNRAINAASSEVVAGVDSLSLLTTNCDFIQFPLTTFWATSAATAQAAGMAAAVVARHPNLWPETVRALIIHSAEWTPAMKAKLRAATTKKAKVALLRQFGYGVPNLDRALASAKNDLALIAQSTIQPFHRLRKLDAETGNAVLQSPSYNEIHYYSLPWPKEALERIGGAEVRLKVVLSYFIEPSPGDFAPVSASRYQSFGLRFELKRATDTVEMFHKRINQLERVPGEKLASPDTDSRWMFGSKHIAAGSLHVDVWTGPAVLLASKNVLAVHPVNGWWSQQLKAKKYDQQARYSLVVSLSTEDQTIDLHTEIQAVMTSVSIASEIEIQVRGRQ